MAKKKSNKIDLGKGLKRVYIVAAIIWISLVSFIFIANFSSCVLYAKDPVTIDCLGYNASGAILEYILFVASLYPLYLILKWIVLGFKKK